jgi:hypothetical protein
MMQAIMGYVREAAPEKTAPKKTAVATCRGAQLRLGLLLLLGSAAAAEAAGGGSPQIADAVFKFTGARAAAEISDPPDPNAAVDAAVDAVTGGHAAGAPLDAPPTGSPPGADDLVPVAAKVTAPAGASTDKTLRREAPAGAAVSSAVELTAACTGSSTKLPQDQCDAWGDFYDALNGKSWTACNGTRTDPCSCYSSASLDVACNSGGTAISGM